MQKRCPDILPLVLLAYSSPTPLFNGTTVISSETGAQQGDPLGPLLFALAIDPIIRSMQSELNIWFLDDGTLAGPVETVARDIERLLPEFSNLGLQLNPKKCEAYTISPLLKPEDLNSIKTLLPGLRVTPLSSLTILNSPINEPGIPDAVKKSSSVVKTICDRVSHLNPHTGLFFLNHYTSAPRLNYLLRTAPMFSHPEELLKVDTLVRETLSRVTNVEINTNTWRQASLPTKFGGMGVRAISLLSLPSFISSLHKSLDLVREIFPHIELQDKPESLLRAESKFIQGFPSANIPDGDKVSRQ